MQDKLDFVRNFNEFSIFFRIRFDTIYRYTAASFEFKMKEPENPAGG